MLRDVAHDQQNQGFQTRLVIDRRNGFPTRHLATDVDNTLYDAFGQRQCRRYLRN